MAPPTVLLIATLDTKGHEAAYLQQEIMRLGKQTLVLDCGMGGQPVGVGADITREQIALAGDSTYEKVQAMNRSDAESVMAKGMACKVKQLFSENRFAGALALGGSDGSILASAGMRRLPLGFPKLIVSAMACGQTRFGEYVGTRDITIMPSGVDILGVNPITRQIFDNAVAAICGMVDKPATDDSCKQAGKLIAVTMFGQTTPCAMGAKPLLEQAGYDLVAFHPNGVGGPLMEEMINENRFQAVWDLTTQELTVDIVLGSNPDLACRLSSDSSVPRVVVPGCLDFLWGSSEQTNVFSHRRCYQFNSAVTLGKITSPEMEQIAALFSQRVNVLAGPATVLLPLQGISRFDKENEPLYDPELDKQLFAYLRSHLENRIKLIEVDAHINDLAFSQSCVKALQDILALSHIPN